jgi:MFS family permease
LRNFDQARNRAATRNYVLGVVNGAAFRFAEALIDPPLVLTWFVTNLTSSNFLIGLVSPLGMVGWFLPQVFVSGAVQRMERKTPVYVLAAGVRTIAWLCLAATLWLFEDSTMLLVGFFALTTFARLSSGVGGLPFFDIIARIIPTRRRGTFFGLRQLIGGLLGLGGAWIVGRVLSSPTFPFPRGHAVLFLAYAGVTAVSATAIGLTREPKGIAVGKRVTLLQQFRRAGQVLRSDRVFDTYIAARASLGLAAIALPFYGVYAKTVLGAPDAMVGVYVGVRVGASLASNLLWGRLSDVRGNRLVMRIASLARGLAALLAIVLVVLVEVTKVRGGWLPYLALPLYLLEGATTPAAMLVGSNFLIEFVPENERPLYLGLSSTLVGTVLLLTLAGGLVADALGFAGLFAVSLALYFLAYGLATALPEPRDALPAREPDRAASS